MYRAGQVAERMGVAVTTIRAWSNEFAVYLSPSAGRQASGTGQRRYTDSDVATLAHAKRLLDAGLTFSEARDALGKMSAEERATMPAPTPPAAAASPAAILPADVLRTVTEAHRGEVEALHAALAQAVARAERAEREADDLRAQLARPALPAPAPEPTAQPPPVSPPPPLLPRPAPPLPWWKRLFKRQ